MYWLFNINGINLDIIFNYWYLNRKTILIRVLLARSPASIFEWKVEKNMYLFLIFNILILLLYNYHQKYLPSGNIMFTIFKNIKSIINRNPIYKWITDIITSLLSYMLPFANKISVSLWSIFITLWVLLVWLYLWCLSSCIQNITK